MLQWITINVTDFFFKSPTFLYTAISEYDKLNMQNVGL
jgi:hypothetical protein